MAVGRGVSFCTESSPSDQCKARGVVASMMASLSVASIGVLAINGNLLMLLNNPRILQPMSKGVCLHRWRNSHITIIILSEIDRYMLLWTWLHEPGSRASQLVPFEKHDRQNSSSEDVIGFLVKRRCIRSRRFVWRLGRSIFNLPVVSLFVANLLTRETLALVEGTYELASRQQQAKKHSLLRQTAYDRSIRVRVRSRKASRRRIVQATTGCGPYISVRAGCKTGCAKMSMNIYPCM